MAMHVHIMPASSDDSHQKAVPDGWRKITGAELLPPSTLSQMGEAVPGMNELKLFCSPNLWDP